MSVTSLQGCRTTYATQIKLMKIKVQNTTVKEMSLESCCMYYCEHGGMDLMGLKPNP